MNQLNISLNNRTIYFDYLRVFATFAVILLHASSQNWSSADVNGSYWQAFNFFDSITRWSVPVFVMISGALFLNRDIPIKKIYSKYILRMAISFIFWSAVYVVIQRYTIPLFWDKIYHMWFIAMIIGIYMCIPFIRAIVEDDQRTQYFLFLAFIFASLIPQIMLFVNTFGSGLVVESATHISQYVSYMNLHMVIGYASYFILGYYIHKITLTRTYRFIIYLLGLLGFAATVVLSLLSSLKAQAPNGSFYGNFTVNVLLEALAVFTWFKYTVFNSSRLNKIITILSKYSFGAFLVHALIMERLENRIGINTLSFPPVLSVIFIGGIVFVISFAFSAVLHQIPVVKKYLV